MRSGQLVPKNMTVARKLYAAAASHGMKEAQARLDQLGPAAGMPPARRSRPDHRPASPAAAGNRARISTDSLAGRAQTLYCRWPANPAAWRVHARSVQVLGVAKTASEAEIKKAFRNLAKKHHPDTHAGDEAAKKRFQEISAAYDMVGDKDKRAKFDAGEIDASGNPRGFDPRAGGFRANPFGFGGSPCGGWGARRRRDFHFSWDDQRRQRARLFRRGYFLGDSGRRRGRGARRPAPRAARISPSR